MAVSYKNKFTNECYQFWFVKHLFNMKNKYYNMDLNKYLKENYIKIKLTSKLTKV